MAVGNNVVFIGRLTKDIELKHVNDLAVARFTLARNKRKSNSEHPEADFVDFVAFGKSAEFAHKYFKKGERVGVHGELSTSMYEVDGKKIKSTNIVVSEFEFIEGKSITTSQKNENIENTKEDKEEDFTAIDEAVSDDDLPF